MKKILLLMCITLFFMASCRKTINLPHDESTKEAQPELLHCGMEEAMASMSTEMQSKISKNVVNAASASELLVFLDFDGALVRPGSGSAQGGNVTSPIVRGIKDCPPPALTLVQQMEVIKLVEDDFSPFKISFTTEQSVYDAYPIANKQVCIITTLPSVLGFSSNTSGISPFAGLGFRLNNNPSFVFASLYGNLLGYIASTISHEVAHTMGLAHQSLFNENCGFVTEYHPGFGTGSLSFSPIMGYGGKRIDNWFAQSCLLPNFGVPQNDFVLLNSQVDLKEDDFPNNPSGNSAISATEITGILEEAGDVDFILINFKKPGPVIIKSENIDVKVSVYDPGGNLISEYNDPTDTGVTIPSVNGRKYLKIEAVSNGNMSSQFMTGQYKISY